MKNWKILSGVVSILLAVTLGYWGRGDTCLLVSQCLMAAGGILSIVLAFQSGTVLRVLNSGIIVLFGASFCVGVYNHAGLWLFTVAAIWCVICCLAACLSIAIWR